MKIGKTEINSCSYCQETISDTAVKIIITGCTRRPVFREIGSNTSFDLCRMRSNCAYMGEKSEKVF